MTQSSQTASSREQNPQKKAPFRHYMRQHPRAFGLGVLTLLFTNIFDIFTPLALKAGIDAVTGKDSKGLLTAIGTYVALMVGVTVFRYLWRIYFGRFHHSVADDLRNRIFEKMTVLGPSFYSKTPAGQLMSLVTSDVNSFRMAIGPGVLILLDAIFYIVMILPVMTSLSWDWTWKSLILLPLMPFFIRKMEALIHLRYREQQDRLAEVSASAQEIVSGVRIIKSYAQEDNQASSFNSHSVKFEEACNRVARVDAAFNPVMESAITVGTVILLYFCTNEVMRGQISIGTFVAFHEYIKRMVWPMSAIGMSISMIEQGRASYDRIHDLLTTATDIPDSGTKSIGSFERLEIQNLSFRYPGSTSDALHDVNLTIHAGETIGIVGPVGAGKTTLLQMISRLYPCAPGAIRINGVALEEIRRISFIDTVSYVTQDAFLFSDTIAENVALGLPAFPGLEAVEDATSLVNIDSEIRRVPGGFDAYLGERGVNLSGGQKQRLTIARALIRRSQIVILDDSLSAVDGKTEKAITDELRSALASENANESEIGRRTVILVSHRLATLKHADRIIVMNRGRIEAVGSHRQLLANCATYRTLHALQSAPAEISTLRAPAESVVASPESNIVGGA